MVQVVGAALRREKTSQVAALLTSSKMKSLATTDDPYPAPAMVSQQLPMEVDGACVPFVSTVKLREEM